MGIIPKCFDFHGYIRPVIDYGSKLFVTASDSALSELDIVRNKALKYITVAATLTPIVAMELQTEISGPPERCQYSALSLALATIHERYPDQNWLHVFTDSSATASFGSAGAGAFSNSLRLKEPLSALSNNFDALAASDLRDLIRQRLDKDSFVRRSQQAALESRLLNIEPRISRSGKKDSPAKEKD
ncbi:uncharacterized protein LOC103524116 [Trichonephila clavipes]|nr:uncharacterized protein LOC103524116 [Trichonephila clavipes]